MELRQLRYFVAAVDDHSITRAAQRLHVVQSALSHQIASLEDELGATLLIRGPGGVRPTTAGSLLYRHAQAALKNVEAARQSVASAGGDVRGPVLLGLPNSTVPLLAVPLLRTVRTQLPLVEISIFEGLSSVHQKMLADGQLDLALLFESRAPQGMTIAPLFFERLHFFSADALARKRYAGLRDITLAEVVRWPLLLPPRPNGTRVLLERACEASGLQLQVAATLSGIHTIWDALKLGLGGSVMMCANADLRYRKSIVMLPIRAPEIQRPAGVVQLQDLPLTPAAAAVKDVLIGLIVQRISDGKWPGATRMAPLLAGYTATKPS